ncbi:MULTISPECIES: hypothetical protein [unclassified Gilliamella]|uniref:hypothetical protein n=1 Tax=unclassified Gilliamella TaxID=2685620 RepID=UPI00080DD91A|nr:hypothetical protein [Gilliamella apicola]OCG20371.1 hypothetical protein A9G23_05945 [Gilliamella apicola]OCG22745.1 hypothetical protein A9G22_06995 [Gilliamella apicola]
MAIDLNLLPQPLVLKKGLSRLFWFIALIVFIVIGLLFIYARQLNSNLTLKHLIISITFSVISWLILFCIWLFIRGCNEAYVEIWNQLREERKQQLIEYGQRPLYVIFQQLISEFGDDNHAQALVGGLMSLEARTSNFSNSYENPIIYSKFPFNDLKPNDFNQKIDNLFDNLQKTLLILNNNAFNDVQKHIRLFIDVPILAEDIKKIWEYKLGKTSLFDSWQVIDAKQSTVFIDGWLDDLANDDHLLCCISVHLFDSPVVYSAEAMTSMIFLGKNLINKQNTIQYIQKSKSVVVALHRTEESEKLDYVLEHAELWGKLNNDERSNKAPLDAIWLSQLSPEVNVNVLSRYIDKQCSVKNIYNIATSFGISGECDYWVALAFAMEYATQIDNKQMVIGEKKSYFNATILDKIKIGTEKDA